MNTSTEHQYHAEGEETEREASFPQPTVIAEDTLGICIGASSGQRAFFDDAAGLIHIVEGRMVSAVELPRGSIPEAPLQPPPSPAPSPSKPLVSPPADADGASGPHTPRGGSPEASPLLALPPGAPSPGPPVRHMRSLSGVSTASSGSMRSFLVSQGPPITAVRTSLDDSATAVQRSKQQVEFLDHATGNMFVASPEMKDAELLGFFWTDCPGADFAMVTSQGLELFALKPQGLRATAVQRLASPQWFLWSHSCRVLVTGCGSTGAKLQSFQFTLRGLIRLPLLDLTPPWGSPTKAASSTAPWLLVSPAQVWVLLLYQRVFIAHQDAGMGVLRLYRLYRDATALRVEIPVPDGPMEPSVVDNVLIIHNLENGTVRLVDVAAAIRAKGGPVCQLEPVCPPAPLGIAAASTQILFDGPPSPLRSEEGSDLAAGLDSSSAVAAVASDAMPSSNRVELYHPEFALDAATGRLLTLKLDLQAVEATCLDPAVALAFVMRRRRSVVPRRDPWHVTLSVLRRLVAERSSPVVLRAAFDAVHAAMAADAPHQAHRSGAGPQNLQDLDDEVVAGVLHSVLLAAQTNDVAPEDSHAKEAIASNLLYLQAAVAELLASCNSHGVRAAPAAAELYIKVYCLRGQMDLLSALLESHAQLLDSSVLAAQLDACARGSRATDGPPSLNGEALQDEDSEPNFEALPLPVPPELARRLAQAMYMRLGDHAAVCRGLMRDGKLMEALRHIKRSGLQGSMVAQECADAAEAMGDAQLVAAAERMLDA